MDTEASNQPPPLVGHNLFLDDRVLVESVQREGGGWAEAELIALGARAGSAEAITWGETANRRPPELRTHDRYGNRVDEVSYDDAYVQLMTVAITNGLAGRPWAEARVGAHVVRAAKFMMWSQVDAGHTCPISMTYSSIPALRHSPELAAEWEPRLTSDRGYELRSVPAPEKPGATCGMAMTEKQGGSDVRANITVATPNGDGRYTLRGHKWFCSAPMCDLFLMLAQAPSGLSCFAVPRWCPDGSRNGIRLQRLKDKLGDRSNASSEIELEDAHGWLVGEEGRGVRTIIEMVNHTRLDCVLGSTAIMRNGTTQAIHHARHRTSFGSRLVDHAAMANVLADLAVESEAATIAAIDLARAHDTGASEEDLVLRRIVTPVMKYWICKRTPHHAVEALECLGGNGYVEESGMPRFFRQSPLNGIWEGSGNVICLDVLRAAARTPEAMTLLLDRLSEAAEAEPRLAEAVREISKELADQDDLEHRARSLVERLATAWQASLLIRHGDPSTADAFCAGRLESGGRAFGTLPTGVATRRIIDRHLP